MATEPFNKMNDILLGYDTDIYFDNDDLMLTNGIDFIEREMYKLLITEPGQWKADPTIGACPNRFTGEQNTREVGVAIEKYVENGLRLTVAPGIPRVRVVPTSAEKIMIFIDINLPEFQRITVPFEFDYVNGIQKVTKMDPKITQPVSSQSYDINDISNLRRPNKYWSRLSDSSMNQL
jgi:hypothetical protein